MRTVGGRLRVALPLVVILAVSLLAGPPGGGEAAADGRPFAHTPAPAPGDLIAAGEVDLRVWISSGAPVTSARFILGDQSVADVSIGPRDPVRGTPVSAVATVSPGAHHVRVEAEDGAGSRVERAWRFTATDRSVGRIAGENRITTAVAASAASFPGLVSAASAVIGRADDFADALAGVPFAMAVDGPLLLSHRDTLPEATAAELRRIVPPGAIVHLLGGEAALGPAVAEAVAELGFRTRRHGGSDRFSTAAVIARAMPPSREAVLVSGTSFADALAASAPAAGVGAPILLAVTDHLPAPTRAALIDRSVTDVTIVGGPAVVSEDVERQVGEIADTVERIAGPDRYATAAAVAGAYFDRAPGVSLASGVDFPDALSGARHAAGAGHALLLTHPRALPRATAEALGGHRPQHIDVYGGQAAVTDPVAVAALRAAVDGPSAPRLSGSRPAAGQIVAFLDAVIIHLDRQVNPLSSSVHLEVGGHEVRARIAESQPTDTLTLLPAVGEQIGELDVAFAARAVIQAVTTDATVGHHDVRFTYLEPDPLFATAGGVELHLPSRDVEMVGFHEANHDGARQQAARQTATRMITLPSRQRGTGSHSSADIVASPDLPVLAPVTGRVIRAGSYVLYCRYTDHYAVIEPDAHPGWEVKVLHFHGLRVRAGDRVTARETLIGEGPRPLPFASQVDEFSETKWPHLHLEIVDPSIPTRPGRGC